MPNSVRYDPQCWDNSTHTIGGDLMLRSSQMIYRHSSTKYMVAPLA